MMNFTQVGGLMAETARVTAQQPIKASPHTKMIAQGQCVGKVAAARQLSIVRAETAEATATKVKVGEMYEVSLEKPLGVLFKEGGDLGIYVSELNAQAGNVDPKMQVGDKLVKLSASFGDEIWDASGYGQAMYAIRTRVGNVYLKLESRGGDTSCFNKADISEVEAMAQEERNSGNVGIGTREVQTMNYIKSQELKRQRTEIFQDGLDLFYKGQHREALELFEKCIGLEPFQGRRRVKTYSMFYRSSQYNCACCYAALGNVEAGLECLEQALVSGYDNYKKVREEDPNLEPLRSDPRFSEMLDYFDEPIINPELTKLWNNLFGKK